MHHNGVNKINPPLHPKLYVSFQIFDRIDSFLKNVINALDREKGILHIERTASFVYNC